MRALSPDRATSENSILWLIGVGTMAMLKIYSYKKSGTQYGTLKRSVANSMHNEKGNENPKKQVAKKQQKNAKAVNLRII